MKAVVFEQPGGTDRLRLMDVENPRPGAGEVLVRVSYCGVNPLDRLLLSGLFPGKPMPHILGSEVGGRVERLGSTVEGFEDGQAVVVYSRLFDGQCPACLRGHEQICHNGGIIGVVTQGGWAEYMVVPAQNVVPLPEGLGVEAAAASAVSGLTAWHMVLNRGRLRAAENVAIFGATGGVGSFALQLGHLAGARVIAVTRHGDREAQLRELGADVVIVEGQGEVAQRIMEATNGAGADLVVDPLGQATWAWSFAPVARNGRWVTCGSLTGAEVGLNLASLYSREVELIGSTGGNRAELRELLRTAARRQLKVPVWRKFPLEGAAEALDSLDKEERLGKVLMELAPGERA